MGLDPRHHRRAARQHGQGQDQPLSCSQSLGQAQSQGRRCDILLCSARYVCVCVCLCAIATFGTGTCLA